MPVGSDAKKDDPHRFEIGEFVDVQKPEYCTSYDEVVARLGGAEGSHA